MPELPEVEVVRRKLAPIWEGQVMQKVWVAEPSYFFLTPPPLLKKRLTGRTVTHLERHGKYLLARLDDASRLLCHLGMTGQLTTQGFPRDPHVHVVFHLKSHGSITFRDVRKFGKIEWIAAGQSSPRLDKLGPDALSISAALLQRGLQGRRLAIKSALLDQSLLAGVGNIYADEALFQARISPLRPAASLQREEVTRLAQQIRRILRTSVRQGGSTINDYLQPDGQWGGYQNWHQVYGKTGEPCPLCATPLARVVLGARSSHFCPACQK